jgi:hypothetical protein
MLKLLRRLFASATAPASQRKRGASGATGTLGNLFDQSVKKSESYWRERHLRQPAMPLMRPPTPLRTETGWLRDGGSRDPNQPRIENGKRRYFG